MTTLHTNEPQLGMGNGEWGMGIGEWRHSAPTVEMPAALQPTQRCRNAHLFLVSRFQIELKTPSV